MTSPHIRTDAEAVRYARAWQVDAYRAWSPGVEAVPRFLAVTGATAPAVVLDYGCGTGRASAALAAEGFRVLALDVTDAGFSEVSAAAFWPVCLWQLIPVRGDYGFCVDVLEHLPTEFVALAIVRMLAATPRLYLEVCTEPDQLGVLLGQPLHQTVRPFVWWRDLLRELGTVRDARDLFATALFDVEAPDGA